MELFQVNERHGRSDRRKPSSHDISLGKLPEKLVSKEERKIWIELEHEIEKSLEEEIKDSIRQKALHLHKIYQQRADIIRKSTSAPGISRMKSNSSNKVFTELTISIKTGGGCSICIHEHKIDGIHKRRTERSKSETTEGRPIYTGKSFDWSKTLRSVASTVMALNGKGNALRNVEYEWKF